MREYRFDFDAPARTCILCAGPISRWAEKGAYGHQFHYDRCQRCGFVFVNSRPTIESLGGFYEGYSDLNPAAVAAEPIRPPVPGKDQLTFIARALRLRPGPGRLLDVGSGTGLASAAASRLGLAVTALEIEPRGAAATRLLPNVTVIPTLFEHYDGQGAPFDHILMSHVLEHAHDPGQFLSKAAGLLAPGGLLWILLPNLDSIYRRLVGTRDPFFIPPTHLNHFNPASLARLCRSAGLRVLESRDYFALPRDVLSKRVKWNPAKPLAEGMTAVIDRVAALMTELTCSGAFVSCCAQKP
jgi:SAM-dependent methyltransferase